MVHIPIMPFIGNESVDKIMERVKLHLKHLLPPLAADGVYRQKDF